jgi:small subunit ribosomal protein S4
VHDGDRIEVREGSLQRTYFEGLPDIAETKTAPHWLDRDLKALNGRVMQLPERRDVDATLNEQLIIEYYSR